MRRSYILLIYENVNIICQDDHNNLLDHDRFWNISSNGTFPWQATESNPAPNN